MAHPNINERQTRVREMLGQGVSIRGAVRKKLADEFQCSVGAIAADIVFLTRPKTGKTRFVSSAMRRFIRERDGRVCQYCSDTNANEYIIEHIFPAALGGEAVPHNLVVACQRCNMLKRRRVWIPKNFESISEGLLEWRETVFRLAANGHTIADVVDQRLW